MRFRVPLHDGERRAKIAARVTHPAMRIRLAADRARRALSRNMEKLWTYLFLARERLRTLGR
jgi:hypothetical protein